MSVLNKPNSIFGHLTDLTKNEKKSLNALLVQCPSVTQTTICETFIQTGRNVEKTITKINGNHETNKQKKPPSAVVAPVSSKLQKTAAIGYVTTAEASISKVQDEFAAMAGQIQKTAAEIDNFKKQNHALMTATADIEEMNTQLMLKMERIEIEKQGLARKHTQEMEKQCLKYEGLKMKFEEMKKVVIMQRRKLANLKNEQNVSGTDVDKAAVKEAKIEVDKDTDELMDLRKMKQAILYLADALK